MGTEVEFSFHHPASEPRPLCLYGGLKEITRSQMSKLRDSIYEAFSAGPVTAVFVMDEQTYCYRT